MQVIVSECGPQIEAAPAVARKGRPKASVVVVTHNARDYLDPCLCSVLSEERPEYEILVVDSASTDGSAEYVEQAFPQVRLIRCLENRGYGHGCNVGVRRAKGEYLAFLNQDTVVEPGWLQALIAAVEADPTAGLATSKVLLLSEPQRINTCGNDMHLTGLTLCRGMGAERSDFAELAEVGAVSGAAFAMRRDLFEALGGFDESFFLYMEDTDLSLRARLAGYECLYVPQSVVYHDYRLHFGPLKTFYQERNRYLMLLKTLRWPTFLVLLPALLLAEAVTWGFVLSREPGRLGNKPRAYAWMVRHWGRVMDGRRRTQNLRRVRDRDLLARFTHRLAYEQAAAGAPAQIARLAFDPLFFLLQRLALALIWW